MADTLETETLQRDAADFALVLHGGHIGVTCPILRRICVRIGPGFSDLELDFRSSDAFSDET